MSTLGELIYLGFPLASLLFGTAYTCRPQPYVWQIPRSISFVVWIFMGLLTGLSGIDIFRINSPESTTSFFLLTWLFGTGWMIANRFCSHTSYFLYSLVVLGVAVYLYTAIKGASTGTDKERTNGSRLLIPLLVWLALQSVLYGYAMVAQYIPKWHVQTDETKFELDPVLCNRCDVLREARSGKTLKHM